MALQGHMRPDLCKLLVRSDVTSFASLEIDRIAREYSLTVRLISTPIHAISCCEAVEEII